MPEFNKCLIFYVQKLKGKQDDKGSNMTCFQAMALRVFEYDIGIFEVII